MEDSMFRHYRALLALTFALIVIAGVPAAFAQQTQGAAQTPPAFVWVNPVKGVAEIQYIDSPARVDKTGNVVKTFQVKNMMTAPIARLTIEQFWWDKDRNPVPGDKQFLKKPLQPGETATITLVTPKSPNMFQDNYKFLHQGGDIKPKKVLKFETAPAK
jgi:hypothetical protein